MRRTKIVSPSWAWTRKCTIHSWQNPTRTTSMYSLSLSIPALQVRVRLSGGTNYLLLMESDRTQQKACFRDKEFPFHKFTKLELQVLDPVICLCFRCGWSLSRVLKNDKSPFAGWSWPCSKLAALLPCFRAGEQLSLMAIPQSSSQDYNDMTQPSFGTRVAYASLDVLKRRNLINNWCSLHI